MSEVNINFLKYNKKRGNFDKEKFSLSTKSLETIIETFRDYSRILLNKAENMGEDKTRLKLSYELKAKECIEIAEQIANEIGYCKDCENARKKKQDDIGSDAMSLMATGYKN